MLIPGRAGVRGRHELLHDRLALSLITRERGRDMRFRLQRLDERDRVLNRKPRAGADRKMGRVQGIADQHDVLERPMLAPNPGEAAPYRFVRDQQALAERFCKYVLANGPGFVDALVGEAVGLPGGAVALDQERAHRWRIAIMMGIERAALGCNEGLRQRLEPL